MKKNNLGYVYISELEQYPKLYAELVEEFVAQGKQIYDTTTVFDLNWSSTKRNTHFWVEINNGYMSTVKKLAPELFEDTSLSKHIFKKRDQVWSAADNRVYEVQERANVDGFVILASRTGIPDGDGVGPRIKNEDSLQLATEDQIFAETKLRYPDGCIINCGGYTDVVVNHRDLKIKMTSGGLDVTGFGVPYLLINGHWKLEHKVTLPEPKDSTNSAIIPDISEATRKHELLEEARRRFRPGKRYVFSSDDKRLLEEELEWQGEDYISIHGFPIVYSTSNNEWREAEEFCEKPVQLDKAALLEEAHRRFKVGESYLCSDVQYKLDKPLEWESSNFISVSGFPIVYTYDEDKWHNITPYKLEQAHSIPADEPIVWKIQGPNRTGSLLNSKANTKGLDTSAVAKEVSVPLLKRKNTSRKL